MWVAHSVDEERKVEYFAKVILIITVVIIDILMLLAAFGLAINNYFILEAFAGLSTLFLCFNFFNVRNFYWTGWTGLGLAILVAVASVIYAQLLRRLVADRRRAVEAEMD